MDRKNPRTKRPFRRTSLGLEKEIRTKITPEMMGDVMLIADRREISVAEVVRRALASFLPDELRRARRAVRIRREREGDDNGGRNEGRDEGDE